MILVDGGTILILETCTEVADYWEDANLKICPVCGEEENEEGYILHNGKRPVIH